MISNITILLDQTPRLHSMQSWPVDSTLKVTSLMLHTMSYASVPNRAKNSQEPPPAESMHTMSSLSRRTVKSDDQVCEGVLLEASHGDVEITISEQSSQQRSRKGGYAPHRSNEHGMISMEKCSTVAMYCHVRSGSKGKRRRSRKANSGHENRVPYAASQQVSP